jgi:hypothetical protein
MEITAASPVPGVAPWLLDPPRETLFRQVQSPFSPVSVGLVLTGSLLSAALAERIMFPSHSTGFGLTYFSFLLAFVLTAFLFHQVSRLILNHDSSFGQWVNAGAIALVPLNVLLPAALACQNIGNSGAVGYELLKIVIGWAVMRRSLWAIEAITRWPSWACLLLLVGPFIVAIIVGAFMMVLLGSVLLVAVLSGLS